ncbi:MAG: CBS domain-containing protein [Nitrospiria bacterium]
MIPRFQVKKVMSTKLHAVPTNVAARAVARLMASENIECVLVHDAGAYVGIITETDIVKKVVGEDMDPAAVTAQDIMSYPIASIEESASLETAHEAMGGQRVRHLMVTKDGEPVGLLSVRSLLDAAYDWALQMKRPS